MSKISDLIFKGKKNYLTSGFGYRTTIDINGVKTSTFHNGSDYGTSGLKLNQYAIEDGVVTNIGTDKYGAKFVFIKYPRLNKVFQHYHLDKILINNNTNVNSNTIIGTTGTTGLSTGIHLHLSILDLNTNKFIDPESYSSNYNAASTTVDEFNINDEVIVNGILYLNSYGNKPGKTLSNHIGKITYINLKGTKPYHIDKLGWVDKTSLAKNDSDYYTIQSGDTLSSIAIKYNTTWQKLYEKNKDVIGSNPNLIKPGMKIKI